MAFSCATGVFTKATYRTRVPPTTRRAPADENQLPNRPQKKRLGRNTPNILHDSSLTQMGCRYLPGGNPRRHRGRSIAQLQRRGKGDGMQFLFAVVWRRLRQYVLFMPILVPVDTGLHPNITWSHMGACMRLTALLNRSRWGDAYN